MPNKSKVDKQIAKPSTTKEKSSNSGRKAPGTRLGTLNDWRQANGNSGKPASRHGQTIRDGR
jgi:hypothetical protein